MIEKIKKYSFLIFHNDYESFLLRIRDLGVVHIQPHKNSKEIQALQAIVDLRKEIQESVRLLESFKSTEPKTPETSSATPAKGSEILNAFKALVAEKNELQSQIDNQRKEIAYWEIWGDFDVEILAKMRQGGYVMDFYTCASQHYKEEWEQEYNATKVNEAKATTYFVTIQKESVRKRLEAEWVAAPLQSLSDLQRDLQQLEARQQEKAQELEHFANNRCEALMQYDNDLANRYEFTNALEQASQMADDKLMWLEGWVPQTDCQPLEANLKEFPCFVSEVEITDEDQIPVKLKNNRFARLFEPITKMYSLPNYGELDVTSLFAPFFMLFFSLCFGDAGYGLLIFLLCTWFKRKASSGVKDILSLGQWLGGTSLAVGLLLGTAFGLIMPWAAEGGNPLGSVRDTYFLNQTNLMYLSIALGIFQIIFGKTVAAIKIYRQRGWRSALSYFGWVAVIVGGIVALLTQQWPIVSYAGSAVAIIGGVLAIFFNSPGKNIFVNVGAGLWNTYNVASGLLGDTLSYIRLFAIGLTSGILGGVFNNLAVNMSEGLPIGINFLVLSFILLFGHGLNMGLAVISSLVHPLRLTFVEFYKNSEFEGGGKEYTPFGSKKQ